jgi:hypothetical protein
VNHATQSDAWLYGLSTRRQRRRWSPRYRLALMRRNKASRTGQMWLTPELEYAPLAPQEIPGPVYDRMMQTEFPEFLRP